MWLVYYIIAIFSAAFLYIILEEVLTMLLEKDGRRSSYYVTYDSDYVRTTGFNFPIACTIWCVIPAVTTGCSLIVLKKWASRR